MKRITKNPLIIFTILISISSCNGQKQPDRIVTNIDLDSIYTQVLKDSILVTGWYYISDTDNGFRRQLDKSDEFYFIDPKPIVIKENFSFIEIFETDFKGQYPDYTGMSIRMDKIGTLAWSEATEKAIGKRLGLVIDNKLVNAPLVNAKIDGGMTALNRNVYSREELEEFKTKIE